MALSIDEIDKFAALAGLRLTLQEAREMASQMEEIVALVDRLEGFDAVEIESGTVVVEREAAEREADEPGWTGASDVPAPCLPREQVLGEAPDTWKGFFVVPRVLPPETE